METNYETAQKGTGALARERLLADLQALSHDAEDLLQATASDLSASAGEARSRVAAALERARTTCTHLQQQTVATARAAAHKADTVIRDHPYQSLGVAFGVGLLLGVVVARR